MLSLTRLHNQALDEFFGFPSDNPDMMKCDVHETKDAYTFEFDLPGISRESIDLSIKDTDLIVTAKREPKKDGVLLRSEKSWGSFKRVFRLPSNAVETSSIKADFKDGVLTVSVPKSATAGPMKIPISDGGNLLKAV